jgi:hypothetical protein
MPSFLHAGTYGDTIYALNAVKLQGGGDLFIELNGMDSLARAMWGGGDAGDHRGRYTQSDLDFLFPFLEKQSYIKNLAVWNQETVDYDLRQQYRQWARRDGKVENWAGNQTECYALCCGQDITANRKALLIDAWLDPVEPIRIPGKSIVVNRTHRHIRRDTFKMPLLNEQYSHWLEQESLADMAVFVGTEQEHSEFCEQTGHSIDYHPVSDMLELARIIQGSEQFIGNQSMALSLAIGLGKTFWCELRVDYENIKTDHGYGDVWFPRANANYF